MSHDTALQAGHLPLLNEIRATYDRAKKGIEYCQKGLKLTRRFPVDLPVVKGYHAAFKMVQASHELFPWAKIMVFEEGKRLMEKQVGRAPANLEIRFLRLSIQLNAPSLLGYTQHIKADQQFLSQHFPDCTDPDLRHVLNTFLAQHPAIRL